MRPIHIPIGRDVFDNSTVNFMDTGSFGVTHVVAVTRYGKSALIKLLYTKLAQHRPVIIFDYRGEHTQSKYPNWNSTDDIMGIPNLNVIQDFKFVISDFANASDWLAMGFPESASREMSLLAGNVEAHHNDPKRLHKLIADLPTTQHHVDPFNMKYPDVKLDRRIHEETQKSMLARYSFMQGFFATPRELVNCEVDYIPDWGVYLCEHPHTVINMNLTDLQVSEARATVGKILEQLSPFLSYLRPVIVIEEADKLAPNMDANEFAPSSLQWILEYAIKLQKYGVEVICICQDMKLLHPTLVGNFHNLLLGQLPAGNPYENVTKKLRWDVDKNYRQFIYIRKGKYQKQVFAPEFCPCIC